MQTLIELYDERVIENIIGPETFRPERVVYLCPPEVAQSARKKTALTSFFAHRGIRLETVFLESSLYKTESIVSQLHHTLERYPDCALDVTGGTDAALVAAGIFSGETDVPVFTWSRKRNRFFSIHNADFLDEQPCTLSYSVEDFILMTGGRLKPGRVDNAILARYRDLYEPFFRLYLKYRRQWTPITTYIQRVSKADGYGSYSLTASGGTRVKGEHGSIVSVNADFLRDAQDLHLIHDLSVADGQVGFQFTDAQTRTWLRDPGSVLELYLYEACLDSGIFEDVICSAVVDWETDVPSGDMVSNEIDVVATRGVIPLFISCKTCEIKTEALNELAILADRFGGKGAKAAIVTTSLCGSQPRHRAAQLGITVIDREELNREALKNRLFNIMKITGPAAGARN